MLYYPMASINGVIPYLSAYAMLQGVLFLESVETRQVCVFW